MMLELAVWREVCRHLDIQESVERIAPLLRDHLGVSGIVVRRLEGARRLCTVARSEVTAGEARTPLDPAEMAALDEWAANGGPLDERFVPRLFGGPAPERLVAGPLRGDSALVGIVFFVGGDGLGARSGQSLLETFATALDNDQRIRELTRLRDSLEADRRALLRRLDRQDIQDGVVGAEGGLREVLRRVDQVARAEAPVLLVGETGSGKEVVARLIHERSGRATGPMVKVNCGAIPPDLVDSELFGHQRGSFTGAVQDRRGWFERADGGTLFLDEVGELPSAGQVRLLRVLQDGSMVRVGGESPVTVDVRVVAATHRDLEEQVRQGRFRNDLWFRLAVFPIHIPPLRERPGDIPDLARHFAWRAGRRLGGAPLTPSAADIEALLAYPWPGNVRELAAVIERAAILGDGRRLDVAAALGSPVPRPGPATGGNDEMLTLEQATVRHIEAALAASRGRIEGAGGAATLLAVDPGTLRSRMRKLGIDWRRHRT